MAAASGSQSTLDGRVLNHSSHLTVYFFSTFASLVPGPRPHGDRRAVAVAITTITMKVGVVSTSISAYPLLSAYFLPRL